MFNRISMYRVQKRKYSSDVIEKQITINNKSKWIVYLCPTVKKIDGDKIAAKLVNLLNSDRNIGMYTPELIIDTFQYKEFYFQRMQHDHMWYVTHNNKIVGRSQYRNDLLDWCKNKY